MADLTNVENRLDEIIWLLKYGNGGNGNGGNGNGSNGNGSNGNSGNGNGGTSQPPGGNGRNIEGFTKKLNVATSAINSTSGGLRGMLNGITNVVSMCGPWGKAAAAAIQIVDALGAAIGSLIDAINMAKARLYQGQAQMFDIRNEQFKQIQTTNIRMMTENVKYQGDLQLKALDTQGQILMNTAKLITQQFVKSAEISIGSLIDGINESAYKAAEAKIEAEAEMEKTLNINEKLEGVFGRYTKQRELEYTNLKDITKTETNLLNVQSDYKMAEAATQQQLNEDQYYIASPKAYKQDEYWKATRDYISKSQSGAYQSDMKSELKKVPEEIMGYKVGNLSLWDKLGYDLRWKGSWSTRENAILQGNRLQWQPELHQSENTAAITKANKELSQTIGSVGQQIADKNAEIQTEGTNLVVDAIKDVKKNWLKLAEANEKWLDKFDKTTNDLGKSLGYTNRLQLDDFQQTMFVAAQTAAKFGKTFEDAVKIQQNFAESTGRNRMFGEEDYLNSMRLSEYLGGDTGLAASYASEMEIFNSGVSDSVDMLGEVLEDVNRMGLNGRKYTKTLVDNLKLAQRYNFKDGTKGLMRMAKWAENTRFNLSSLGGMLDKISEGGLEGIITQGAQFQVLGGHAAMNADPIAMWYERYADPEALMKRYQDMTKGYGQVDKETGETKFSGNEVMMMEQIAKIQGRSLEEVQNEVRARNKKERVAKELRGNFDEDQQAFISNNATYDKETGQFKVKVKGSDGKYHDKEVSQLTEADLEDIMPADYQGKMLKNMDEIVDSLSILTGKKESAQATVAENTWDVRKEEYKKRGEIADEMFRENMQLYIDKATEYSQKITESYGDYTTAFEEGAKKAEDFPKNIEGIQQMAKSVEGVLGETASIISNANSQIASAIGVGLEKLKNPEFVDYGGEGKHALKKQSDEERTLNAVARVASEYMNKEMMWTMTNNGATGKSNFKNLGSAIKGGKTKDILSAINEGGLFTHSIGNYFRKSTIDWNSLSDAEKVKMAKQFYNSVTNSETMKREGNKEYWDAKKNNWSDVKDGVISGGNKPMIAKATNVTKINDGLVQSDPKDVAIFAKEGGVIGNFLNDLYSDVHSSMGGSLQLDTLNVQISGSLDLSSGGQSVDIINELQNNPILLRSLSRMLAQHISSAMNGGRGSTNLSFGSI